MHRAKKKGRMCIPTNDEHSQGDKVYLLSIIVNRRHDAPVNVPQCSMYRNAAAKTDFVVAPSATPAVIPQSVSLNDSLHHFALKPRSLASTAVEQC